MAWLSGYTYRRKLTIDSSKVDSSLTDFPVTVIFTSSNLDFSSMQADGDDIRFTDSDGTTVLDYEVERFDQSGSKAEYHVKIPSVSDSSNTIFYVYYVNTGATGGSNATGVWDSNFKMVQHLKGASVTDLDDSTSNNNDFDTEVSSPSYDTDAKVGKGIDFDGSDDYITCPDSASLDLSGSFLAEALINPDNATNARYFMGKAEYNGGSDNSGFAPRVNSNRIQVEIYNNGGGAYFSATSSIAVDTWYHVALQLDDTNNEFKIFINGSQSGSTHSHTAGIGTNNAAFSIARIIGSGFGTAVFNGTIDEVRISDSDRTDAWIKATYHSLFDTLLTYGAEETESGSNSVFFGCNF